MDTGKGHSATHQLRHSLPSIQSQSSQPHSAAHIPVLNFPQMLTFWRFTNRIIIIIILWPYKHILKCYLTNLWPTLPHQVQMMQKFLIICGRVGKRQW